MNSVDCMSAGFNSPCWQQAAGKMNWLQSVLTTATYSQHLIPHCVLWQYRAWPRLQSTLCCWGW